MLLPALTPRCVRRAVLAVLSTTAVLLLPAAAGAQDDITRVDLSVGRSFPIQAPVAVSRVTVANPDVADVVVVGEREVVVNGKQNGETDILLFGAGQFRRQYRVQVHTPADRPQIVLGVKFAEVRRDALTQAGLSGLYRAKDARVGSDIFRTDDPIDPATGAINLNPTETRFLTVLTDFGTRDLLALIQAEASKGRARILAEPNLMTANRDSANFLAGGEIPIPLAQPGQNGQIALTITFREFGVRLFFLPEILNDSLVKLRVRPEVSSLDFGNAVLLSGFRVPALRTRRIETTVDVRRDRSLIISGLFNEEREQVKTGIPFLQDVPLLGSLFSSRRWQSAESELVVIVTPIVIDPLHPRPQDTIRLRPDTALPARDAIEKRLPPPGTPPAPPTRRP